MTVSSTDMGHALAPLVIGKDNEHLLIIACIGVPNILLERFLQVLKFPALKSEKGGGLQTSALSTINIDKRSDYHIFHILHKGGGG